MLDHAGLSTRAQIHRLPLRRPVRRQALLREHRPGRRLPSADHPRLGHERPLLPVPNGAPLRLRVERQLGYKQAKYVQRIEAVDSLAGICGGKGGYWEDNVDYEWYAGI